jgi:hypothetical protein
MFDSFHLFRDARDFSRSYSIQPPAVIFILVVFSFV